MRTRFIAFAAIAGGAAALASAAAGVTEEALVEPVAAEEGTLFPVPDYRGSLGERSFLSGNWREARTHLAERGLQVNVSLAEVYQGVIDGGLDSEWRSGGSAEISLKFDFHKLGLWDGAFLQINGESRWGRSVDLDTGMLIPVNSDALYPEPGEEGLVIPSIVFTQFLSERFAS